MQNLGLAFLKAYFKQQRNDEFYLKRCRKCDKKNFKIEKKGYSFFWWKQNCERKYKSAEIYSNQFVQHRRVESLSCDSGTK